MWDYDRLHVNGTMGDKAVASSRTHARDARTFYTCWDPVGPVRIAPLVAPVRAVLARPCGPSDALLGPLGRAIVPGPLGFVCGWWGRVMCLREIVVVRYASARFHFGQFFLIPLQPVFRGPPFIYRDILNSHLR